MKHLILVLPITLGACVGSFSSGDPLVGDPPANLITHRMVNPIGCLVIGVCTQFASATEIAPGWAATPHHAFAPWSADDWPVDAPPNMDLVFYKTNEATPLTAGTPHDGDKVMLYGASLGPDRQASGVVVEALTKMWDGKAWRTGMFIETDASNGFSGGPVINAQGQWIGMPTDKMVMTWGPHKGARGLFAYWAGDVLEAMPKPVAKN